MKWFVNWQVILFHVPVQLNKHLLNSCLSQAMRHTALRIYHWIKCGPYYRILRNRWKVLASSANHALSEVVVLEHTEREPGGRTARRAGPRGPQDKERPGSLWAGRAGDLWRQCVPGVCLDELEGSLGSDWENFSIYPFTEAGRHRRAQSADV